SFSFPAPAATEIYTLSLHDALPISAGQRTAAFPEARGREARELTRAFEDMRSELADLGRIEEYTTLLSHELKNPTASIRAVAERSEEHTSELQSQSNLVCRLLLEKK